MKQPGRYTLVTLSIAGGVMSALAWTAWCPGLILLVSFVPFLLIENHLYNNRHRYTSNAFFIYLLPGFFIFSMMTLGWMRVATMAGAITVIMGMTFFMAFTMWLAHYVRQKAGNLVGFVSLITFWLAFEYATLNVNIITPWINLGNGLAKDILFVQWYDTTGTGGGTLWILLSNLFLAISIESYRTNREYFKKFLFSWLIIVLLPSVVSVTKYLVIHTTESTASEVVIIQPNTDPYTEKFNIPFTRQLSSITEIAMSNATPETDWIIMPETIVDDAVNLNNLSRNRYVRRLRGLARRFPNASVVAGLVTFQEYPQSDSAPTKSARYNESSGIYSDYYNSALKTDTSFVQEYYHKSKLVPGIEMQFSNGIGRIAAKLLPYLGGTKWGYGIQEERSVFTHIRTGQKTAPVICYESAFGDYVADYVRAGAESIFIITNDGWWKNTDGYRQHLTYASLRAIETRRPIARSANTGISCIIDIRGKREKEIEWWSQGVIRGSIYPETRITPYVRYGDSILRIATGISILTLLLVFILYPTGRK